MAVAANALTTLAALKEELGISGSTEDTYLERLINIYSDYIESLLNRKLQNVTVTDEKHAGMATRFLAVKRYPLTTLTSVKYNDVAISSGDYEIYGDGSEGMIFNKAGSWLWGAAAQPSIGQDPTPGTEIQRYKITYAGGYVLPGDGGTLTLPYELDQLCVEMAVEAYRRKGEDRAVKSEKLLSASIAYFEKGDMPARWKSIINKHARRL